MRERTPYSAGGTYHVFLSFSGPESRDAAAILAHWIEKLLYSAVRGFFYGPDSVMVGENWLDHVYDGAGDSDALIAFLTRENIDGYWINEELEAATGSQRCSMVLLILLDGLLPSDLPLRMQSRQAKPWSPSLLKSLLVLIGREARVKDIEMTVRAQERSIDNDFYSVIRFEPFYRRTFSNGPPNDVNR